MGRLEHEHRPAGKVAASRSTGDMIAQVCSCGLGPRLLLLPPSSHLNTSLLSLGCLHLPFLLLHTHTHFLLSLSLSLLHRGPIVFSQSGQLAVGSLTFSLLLTFALSPSLSLTKNLVWWIFFSLFQFSTLFPSSPSSHTNRANLQV